MALSNLKDGSNDAVLGFLKARKDMEAMTADHPLQLDIFAAWIWTVNQTLQLYKG